MKSNVPRTQCPVCAGTGNPGVVGTEKVTFGARRLLGVPVPAMVPVRESGGMPYAGTGLRLRRSDATTGMFCATHATDARRRAAEGLTMAAAIKRMTHP